MQNMPMNLPTMKLTQKTLIPVISFAKTRGVMKMGATKSHIVAELSVNAIEA